MNKWKCKKDNKNKDSTTSSYEYNDGIEKQIITAFIAVAILVLIAITTVSYIWYFEFEQNYINGIQLEEKHSGK